MDLNNELLIDQVMSYTIQAGDVLHADFLVDKKTIPTYSSLLLPSGPDFYTGPLKAAGYLLLQPTIKKLILVIKQDQFPNQITIYKGEGLTILGQKVKTKLTKTPSKLVVVNTISEEIQKQLVFLRIIKSIEQVTILGIGTKVDAKDIVEMITTIKGKKADYGCIFFDTCSSEISMEKGKKLDEYLIKQVFLQKTNKKLPNRLGNSFVLMSKYYHQKPDIVGYFNSGDFGGDPSKSTGYACIVA